MDLIPLSGQRERAYCQGAVGVLDSGVGGLSVLRRLVARMPHQPFLYFADRAWCPYGSRPIDEVCARVMAIADAMVALGCAVVVLACNTATSAAVVRLRERLSIPVVGMEPAVKPAVEATRTGHIAVLGTQVTLRGEKLHNLETRYGRGVTIHHVVGAGLVELVEDGHFADELACEQLRRVLSPLADYPVDQLVLGCTHYPFLQAGLRRVLPDGVALVDPAPAVALQADRVRSGFPVRQLRNGEGGVLFSTSASDLRAERLRLEWYWERFCVESRI